MKTVKQYLASDFEAVTGLIKEHLDPNEVLVNEKSYELFIARGQEDPAHLHPACRKAR